jgi:hypothetical protein
MGDLRRLFVSLATLVLAALATIGMGATIARHQPPNTAAVLMNPTATHGATRIVDRKPNLFGLSQSTMQLIPADGQWHELELRPALMPASRSTYLSHTVVDGVVTNTISVEYELGQNVRTDTADASTPDAVKIVIQRGDDVILCERAPDIEAYCFLHTLDPTPPLPPAGQVDLNVDDAPSQASSTENLSGDFTQSRREVAGIPSTCVTTGGENGSDDEWCFANSLMTTTYTRLSFNGYSMEMTLTDFSSDVSGSDFEPPYPLVDRMTVGDRWSDRILLLAR